jgi:hypothetical protein
MRVKISVRNALGVFDSDETEMTEEQVEQVMDLAKSTRLTYFALVCTRGAVTEDLIFRQDLINNSVISVQKWD